MLPLYTQVAVLDNVVSLKLQNLTGVAKPPNATDASLLQLVTGNITLARTGGTVDDTTVALGGFATPVKFYNFTETTISSSASWVYKGSI